jgi:DNA-binding MarR family transcriptional regulator
MSDRIASQVTELLDEVRKLFHLAAQVAEELHAGEPITVSMRAVLELLQRTGPATVPEIARRRYVTRQHIQTLVNALLARGLVAAEANPAHRRSPRIALTADGGRMIRRVTERERRLLARLDPPLDADALAAARETLTTLRTAIGALHEQQRASQPAS